MITVTSRKLVAEKGHDLMINRFWRDERPGRSQGLDPVRNQNYYFGTPDRGVGTGEMSEATDSTGGTRGDRTPANNIPSSFPEHNRDIITDYDDGIDRSVRNEFNAYYSTKAWGQHPKNTEKSEELDKHTNRAGGQPLDLGSNWDRILERRVTDEQRRKQMKRKR